MMSEAFSYSVPVGAEMIVGPDVYHHQGTYEGGYKLLDTQGVSHYLPYADFTSLLKSGNASLDLAGGRSRKRLGGFETVKSLNKTQQRIAAFNHACALAVRKEDNEIARQTEGRKATVSIRYLQHPDVRDRIADFVNSYSGHGFTAFGSTVSSQAKRPRSVPKGRTLMRLYEALSGLMDGEDRLEAFVPLDHLKGNRGNRLHWLVYQLACSTIKEIGLNTRQLTVANLKDQLEVKIDDYNKFAAVRVSGGSDFVRRPPDKLSLPAHATLRQIIRAHVSPTELFVAHHGVHEARNKFGRGSTDIRALLFNEFIEIDEGRLDVLINAVVDEVSPKLGAKARAKLKEKAAVIQQRYAIVLAICVATKLVVGWVITENPNAEATLQVLRMATRSKELEARQYGYTGPIIPGAAVGRVMTDGGTGVRNTVVKNALLGMGTMSMDARSYAATDKPNVERVIGSMTSRLINPLPGSTGRSPSHKAGHDAVADTLLDLPSLYALVSIYFLEEYPNLPHRGLGLGGRTPLQMLEEVQRIRGATPPPDAARRRLQLGMHFNVSASHEGVTLFQHLSYNCDELQKLDLAPGTKVDVYLDPDDLEVVTIAVQGHKPLINAALQTTAYAGMTLPEFRDLGLYMREIDPCRTEFDHDYVMESRRKRNGILERKFAEANRSTGFIGLEKLRKDCENVFRGTRHVHDPRQNEPTLDELLDPGVILERDRIGPSGEPAAQDAPVPAVAAPDEISEPTTKVKKPSKKKASPTSQTLAGYQPVSTKLSRPVQKKGFI